MVYIIIKDCYKERYNIYKFLSNHTLLKYKITRFKLLFI